MSREGQHQVKEFADVIVQLRAASRQVVRELGFLQIRYDETGCTHSQCHVLVEIDSRRSVAVGELADILGQDISSTSRIMRSLIEHDYVEALVDSRDGRKRPYRLTRDGRKKVRLIHEVANSQVQAALALLTPTDQDIVVRGMCLYARALTRSKSLASITIRPITAGDDEAISAIIRRVMTEYGATGSGTSIADAELRRMSSAYRGNRSAYFVALNDATML